MTQTLLVVVLFVGAMALLPWLVRKLQQRQSSAGAAQGGASRVVSAVAVGPQQKVVTIEVGPDHARTWLVLGVTATQINCLHVGPASTTTVSSMGASAPSAAAKSFGLEMAAAVNENGKPVHD